MKYKGAGEEKAIGCTLLVGFIICVISAILIWIFTVAGVYRGTFTRTPITNQINDPGTINLVPLCILAMVVGLLMISGALAFGFFRIRTAHKGPRRVEPYLRVMNRVAYDGPNLMISVYEYETAEKPRFYIKALTQKNVIEELETSLTVFLQAGEGMVGEGEIQGNWLGRFVPYIGEPASPNGGAP